MSAGHEPRHGRAIRNLRTILPIAAGAAAVVVAVTTSVLAQPASGPSAGGPTPAAAGRRIVERDCAGCHAVGPQGASPLPQAPPFRDLHRKYDVEDLAESLAEGIVAGHPAMPERTYEPSDVAALIAYLKSLGPAADAGVEKPAP
jgi:cytochrome c